MILVIIQWSEWADWVDAMVEGDMENTGAMPDNSQAGLDLRKGGVTWCFTRRLTETQKQSQRMKFSNKKKKSDSVTRCFECKDLKTHRQQGWADWWQVSHGAHFHWISLLYSIFIFIPEGSLCSLFHWVSSTSHFWNSVRWVEIIHHVRLVSTQVCVGICALSERQAREEGKKVKDRWACSYSNLNLCHERSRCRIKGDSEVQYHSRLRIHRQCKYSFSGSAFAAFW